MHALWVAHVLAKVPVLSAMAAKRKRGSLYRVLCTSALLIAPAVAHAHAENTSYLKLQAQNEQGAITGAWDLNAADLDWNINLDVDGNGSVTWAEILARREGIVELASRSLRIERGAAMCPVSIGDMALTRHTDALFISLALTAQCPASGSFAIHSSLFFAEDSSQRVLLEMSTPETSYASVLSPRSQSWQQPERAPMLTMILRFVGQGMWHVATGYDHVAFVLLLLLPSVLRRGAAQSMGSIARDLLRVVTMFTIAHSITLWLSVTRIVELPVQPVEMTILVSIGVAALINLSPRLTPWRIPLAFGFGLVHGFGFANALREIDTAGAHLLPMLAGFNIGVELAQLTIVLIALPLFMLVSKRAVPVPTLG